jgi:exopolyphosphatase/guanosine-5'-triphosphate,3'-diphosphate pyrophosphatase
VDVGSNSVLLVVGELKDGVWVPLKETSVVTALGEGVRRTHRLSEEGMARTLEAIKQAFAVAESFGAETRAYGTMALRIVENAGEFLLRAQAQGTPVSVLSGEREAELGLKAVREDPLFASCPHLVIVDVGGHSTEIAWASREEKGSGEFQRSFPLGTLGLRDLTAPTEKVEGEVWQRTVKHIDEVVGALPRIDRETTVVALGATATNLITLRDRITEWDPARVHGKTLSYEELSDLTTRLLSLTDAERTALPGLESGRERTIHLGALILQRVLHHLGASACTVSTRGWRHALLAEE